MGLKFDPLTASFEIGGGECCYKEGDTSDAFCGPVVMGEGPANNAEPIQLDADGNLKIVAGSIVSATNSSTTPLAANGVFTGAAIDITTYAVINVCVFSNVASATNGVAVQFSTDGTNWDHSHSTTYAAGGSGVGYIFNAEFKYARVVYTNGATPQTTFRLQTLLKATRVQSSLLRLNQNPTENYFAELTKSVIIGRSSSGGGTFVDVKVNPSGSLTTAIGDITGVVGQNTMANSLPVAIASDQTGVPVTDSQASFDHGSSSIGTSAVQITTSSIAAKKGVLVKASNDNSDIVYVGNSDVTAGTNNSTDGFELANGESVFLEVDNANKVYVIGSASGQKVFWTAV